MSPRAKTVPIALTIAGSDSGGGAGVQADLKTFHQYGVFGTSVIVAVTAQNTVRVADVHEIPGAMVTSQMQALADDLPPAAVKTGMLATPELVDLVATNIERFAFPCLVVDPVMVATSGDRLLSLDAERVIAQRLLPLATLVTPNLDEARLLLNTPIEGIGDMERSGHNLMELGASAVLIKGGHQGGDDRDVVDVLVTADTVRHFRHPRIATTSTHGTGCTLSAAVAAGLAHGRDLVTAVADGVDFVYRAIVDAPALGHGHGPVNHFVAPTRSNS